MVFIKNGGKMKEIRSIGVYCSSSNNVDQVYKNAAFQLGKALADRDIQMIFGGGGQGLMGIVANAAMENNGHVIGYMPNHLKKFEDPNWMISELHMVDNMHTRKRLMFENSEAFFILPGGFGTLDETFELITWRQLELHEKPIVFININGYWDSLKEVTKNIFAQHFADPEDKKAFMFVNSVEEALQVLYRAPEPKAEESTDWL